MKKTVKKLVSALLVFVMLMSVAPLSGFVGVGSEVWSGLCSLKASAEEFVGEAKEIVTKKVDELTESLTEDEVLTTSSTELESSGSCGDNVKYTFDSSTGLLTISGTGDMKAYFKFNNEYIKTVVIKDGVTSIGEYSFQYCTGLTNITIPDSVTSIGDYAFERCTGLTSVKIGNSVTSIGSYAFYYCDSLISVTIGDSVTSIGEYAFSECTRLTSVTIPDSATSIGNEAFYKCTGLTSVTIGNCVSSIGECVFEWCPSLTSITVDEKNQYYSSDEYGVLFNKDKTELIKYPVSNIRTTYKIPDSVTSIGDGAFNGCIRLINLTIPDSVTSIGEEAFGVCTGLTSITIPDSVTSIGQFAFYECTGLTSITIPDSVTSIGQFAFYECTGLTSVTIPDSVTNIGYYAFYNCTSLNDIYFDGSEEQWDGAYPYSLPDNVIVHFHSHIHSFLEKIEVYPTVEKEGVMKYYCKCGYSYDEPISKLSYSSEKIEKVLSSSQVEEISVKFDSSWFVSDPTDYNHELSKFCSDFSLLGYCYDEKEIKTLLQEMEFDSTKIGEIEYGRIDTEMETGRDEVNYFIASKRIKVSENEFDILVFVGTIGSFKTQWYSNFDPEAKEREEWNGRVSGKNDKKIGYAVKPSGYDDHLGFADAREFIYGKLAAYIEELEDYGNERENIKILLTGHSRGAATANMLAAKLADEANKCAENRLCDAGNIYAYTFATPNVTTNKNCYNKLYDFIHNIVNPEDFVTKVMLVGWGYKRYGKTYTLPSSTNTTSKKYRNMKLRMENIYLILTGDEIYYPYDKGEAVTYNIIQKMEEKVPDADGLYTRVGRYEFKLDLNLVPIEPVYIHINSFFKNTLLKYLATDDYSEIIRIFPTCESFYKSIIYYLAIGEILTVKESLDIDDLAYKSKYVEKVKDAFLNSLGNRFKQSHGMTTYCAYVNALTSDEITKNKNAYNGSVNCPVDVEIYDKTTGDLVGRIVDNIVDEKVASGENAVVMTVDGDSKQFWLPSDGDYEIKLIGNDEGTMDYTVSNVDSDTGEIERINFFDVKITNGFTMSSAFESTNFELKDYTLDLGDGNVIEPTEQSDDISNVKINISSTGNGTASESMVVTSGDYVTLSATPNDDNYFVGWYNGDTLVSSDETYSFVAKKSVTLTAKFKENQKPDRVNSVSINDISLNYKQSTTIKPIIEMDGEVKYTVEYKSSNESVAKVDKDGNVTTCGKGSATITCTVTDEFNNKVEDTCTINVKFSFGQWIIWILLLGFLWY